MYTLCIITEESDADLVVVGGGMAGMTCAAVSVLRGLRVIVLEKAAEIGGSAALSEGYVWTAPTLDVLMRDDPDADRELGSVLVSAFPAALSWLLTIAEQARPVSAVLGFGEGVHVDIKGYLQRCRALVESNNGWVVTGSRATSLRMRDGVVRGVETVNGGVTAPWTVLATGGFQGDETLLARYIRPRKRLTLRANPNSTGDGLRMSLAAGAATHGDMAAFYGHLLPSPLTRPLRPSDFGALAQFHSPHGVLLDSAGNRFTDESRGDYANAQAVARTPTGLAILVCDERVRREHVLTPFIPGMDAALDKFELASAAGARVARAPTLAKLAAAIATWDVDADAAIAAVHAFNRMLGRPGVLPPRAQFRDRLEIPPFVALEVQPAITFTYGGILTDLWGRVLSPTAAVIPGVLAAGVDVGGLNRSGYSGGLARGLVSGYRAALVAAGAAAG